MLSLDAFFDESGKLADSQCVAFAGCVCAAEDWVPLCARWQGIFDQSGVTHLHMNHAVSCSGEFKKFKGKEKERDELLVELAKAVFRSNYLLVGSPILTSEFKALPEADRKRLKNVQYCGFEACIKGLVRSASENLKVPWKIGFVCDLSEEYSNECLSLFIKIRNRDPFIRKACPALTFGDDEALLPLQVADMYAYCCRERHLEKHGLAKPHTIVNHVLQAMSGGRDVQETGLLYKAGKLQLGRGELEG